MVKLIRSRNHASDIPSLDYGEDAAIRVNEDDSISSKIKHGTAGQIICGVFEEYCSYSTIHGTKYLGETKRHWLEKIWWILAFASSLFGCGLLIRQVYDKWDQSPVIVSFSERSTPIYEIPFPSVTICPETKANKTMIDFTKVYHEMHGKRHPPYAISDEEQQYMEAVSQVCDAHLTDNFEIGGNISDNKLISMLKEIAPTINETMRVCKFRNKLGPCNKYFEEIMTDEGVCFTFNMLKATKLYREGISKDFLNRNRNVTSNWSLESGYEQLIENEPQIYPYRVFGPGARAGLFVLLRLHEPNLDYICKGPVQGFKILLHQPGEFPQVSKQYFRVPLLQEVLVSVKPNMMTTSGGLLDYNPNRRQCFFNSERHLRFFKVYTQSNCELECLANYTMKKCGCARFSMPRDEDSPICGSEKIACYNRAEDDLLQEHHINGITTDKDPQSECNCLPGCTSIRYDAEISQAAFDWKRLLQAFNISGEDPGQQPARLAIFFRENQFITSKRSELYGRTDFLANCGGLLGLFMGVSLLSIIEIIYHVTLRLCCNLRKRVFNKTTNTNEVILKPLPNYMLDPTFEKVQL